MARTKRGVTSRAKHNKVLKLVKGQYGRRKKQYSCCTSSYGENHAICLQRQKSQEKRV